MKFRNLTKNIKKKIKISIINFYNKINMKILIIFYNEFLL